MDTDEKPTVMVVDDDPAVLGSTTAILTEFGYNVIDIPDAEEAFSKLKKTSVDVVVSDIVMPSITGLELLEKIHNHNPAMPVILMTAYADIDKLVDAVKKGAFDFIIKPFGSEMLIHSVGKAVKYNNLMQIDRDYKRLLEEFNEEIETLVEERTMSIMALTLADKIRNPAAVIGITCRRILEKEELSDKLKQKIDDIIGESDKLDRLVHDFDSFMDKRSSMFRYEDINGIVKSIVSIFKGKARSKGIDLLFNPDKKPLRMNLQRKLFQLALSHLVKNAIEATPDGGRIEFLTGDDGTNATLTICDTGYGIDSEDIEKIFDPMFSTKDRRFGVGLPLVKRIMSEHMGEIKVESMPGEGTKFIIKLPLRWTGKGN